MAGALMTLASSKPISHLIGDGKMSKLTKLGARRLLRLAKILDTADALHKERGERTYSQDVFVHHCGTPACALGHYAANNKRRGWGFKAADYSFGTGHVTYNGHSQSCADPRVLDEFDLSFTEAIELFSGDGCNGARTGKQAAKYIQRFVKRKGVA